MFFEIVALLILSLLIVTNVWLALKIPDDKTMSMISKANLVGTRALDTAQLYIDSQKDFYDLFKKLDDKMNALSRFVDDHSTNVTFQMGQFSALAKADVVLARQEELRRLKELKVALERLMGVALTSRQPPSPNDVVALENINERINELEEILKDR